MNDLVYRRHAMASEVGPEDIILYFFSSMMMLWKISASSSANAASHTTTGITPPELVQVFDPELSAQCAKAIRQLPLLLGAVRSDPPLIPWPMRRICAMLWESPARCCRRRSRLFRPKSSMKGNCGCRKPTGPQRHRFVPTSLRRPDQEATSALRIFSIWLRSNRTLDPLSAGTIVGAADTPAYSDYLNWVQTRQLNLPGEAVPWLGSVSEEELARAYQEATVYLSMSEHEGFCLPILEAMMHNVPVFAYDLPGPFGR